MNGKRLFRSRNDRMLCGVCGGIAEYFNIDPTLIRLLVAILLPVQLLHRHCRLYHCGGDYPRRGGTAGVMRRGLRKILHASSLRT